MWLGNTRAAKDGDGRILMKSVLTALLLSISLIFSSGMTSYAQDLEKGLRAAQSGDFAAALREWMPLA